MRATTSRTSAFPASRRVCLTAAPSRSWPTGGGGDVKLFAFLESLGLDYAIRFRRNIQVAAENGETRLAADRVGKGGRARMLRDVEITAARCAVPAIVCVHAKDMKEPWRIATSRRDATS